MQLSRPSVSALAHWQQTLSQQKNTKQTHTKPACFLHDLERTSKTTQPSRNRFWSTLYEGAPKANGAEDAAAKHGIRTDLFLLTNKRLSTPRGGLFWTTASRVKIVFKRLPPGAEIVASAFELVNLLSNGLESCLWERGREGFCPSPEEPLRRGKRCLFAHRWIVVGWDFIPGETMRRNP